MWGHASKKSFNWGILVLRLMVGAVFIYHGWLKLNGMAGTTGMMAGIGLPMPIFWAWLVALVEFVGGIAVVLGVFNRIVTVVLAINMVCALLLVHSKLPYGMAELPLLLLASVLALHFTGAGKFAVMHSHEGCECNDACASECKSGENKDECCGGDCGCCENEHHEEKKENVKM